MLERIKRKWLTGSNRCTGLERVSTQTNIGLRESQGAFYILAIGIVAATLVLTVEKISKYFFKSPKCDCFVDGPCLSCFHQNSSDIPMHRRNNVNPTGGYHVGSMIPAIMPIHKPLEKNLNEDMENDRMHYVDLHTGKVTYSKSMNTGEDSTEPELSNHNRTMSVKTNGVLKETMRKNSYDRRHSHSNDITSSFDEEKHPDIIHNGLSREPSLSKTDFSSDKDFVIRQRIFDSITTDIEFGTVMDLEHSDAETGEITKYFSDTIL